MVIPHWPRNWECRITIGMPLRTEKLGVIPRSFAVSASIRIAEDVARDMDYELPDGIFCRPFVEEVKMQFKVRHEGLGAKVTQ